MSLSSADITSIVGALQESDWDEAVVVIGDVRIAVARNGAHLTEPGAMPTSQAPAATPVVPARAAVAPAVPAPAASAPAPLVPVAASSPASPGSPSDHVITAPSVGVFWRAPEPGAAPFVEVGSRIEVGDTVGIVEIMKLMNNVASKVAGVVTAVHLDNGAGVEFGTPLISIALDES